MLSVQYTASTSWLIRGDLNRAMCVIISTRFPGRQELGWLLTMASADLVHSEGLASVVKQYHAKLRREAKKGRGYRIARVNCPHVM